MNPLSLLPNGMFGSDPGSTLDLFSKLGIAVFGFLPVVLGIWKLGILKQPPGHAGVMLSWNNQVMIKRHRDNSCVRNCGHTLKKRPRYKIIYWGKYAREVKKVRKHRFEVLRFMVCKEGCECTHMMGKIVWPGIRLKFPWRKNHEIPLMDRANNIDPITIDVIDPLTGRLQQRRFEGTLHWRVSDDVFDDAPLRADHQINVRDLDVTVVQRVTKAANLAERKYGITSLLMQAGEGSRDDPDNLKAIYNHVNDLVAEDLDRYGVVMFDFELRESARTGQQVLADALGGAPSSVPPDGSILGHPAVVVALTDDVHGVDTSPGADTA